jgi:hypothetical protein
MTSSRNYLLLALVAALLFTGGYATGRHLAPDKVVVTEKVVTVETSKSVHVVDTDRILSALKDVKVARDVHTIRVVEKQPDGTTKITETKDDKSKTESKTESNDQEHKVDTKVEERTVYRDREVTKLVERQRPNWSLALQPGFEFASAVGLGDAPFNLLGVLPVKHVMANLLIERRLAGPLFVGAWANTHLDGGVSLRLEW